MDLEELRTVRDKERRTDSLQHLRDEFYDEATEYVRQLKRERSKHAEAAGDPYTPQAMRLTDEIDAAEETIESLYERRRGKLVKLASFAAAGQNVETGGLTDQERDLFDDLVERIEANERQVFGQMEVATTGGATAAAPEADTTTPNATPGSAGERETARAGGVETPSADERTSAGVSAETDRGEPVVGRDDPEDSADGPSAADSEEPNAPAAVVGTPDAASEAASDAAHETASDAARETPRDAPADTRESSADTGGASGVLAEAMGGDTADSSSDGRPATDSDVTTASNSVESPTDATNTTTTDATSPESTPSATTDTTTTDGPPSTPASEPLTDDDRPAAEAAAVIGGDESPSHDNGRVGEGSAGEKSAGTESGRSTNTDSPTSADAASETPSVEREAVRVTRDVGEVYGVDERSYELAAGDTVLLPAANVDPLVERDAAERL